MAWTGTQAWTGADPWADNIPPTPPVLTVTVVTSTRNDLAWTAIPAASSYDIERNGTVLAYGYAGTTYSDTAATSGGTDTYRVRAVD
jgi:hypothetical protein